MRKMSTGLPKHLLPAMKNQQRRRRRNTALPRPPLLPTLNLLLPPTRHQLRRINLNPNTSPSHHIMQDLSLNIGLNLGLHIDQNLNLHTSREDHHTNPNLNTNPNPSTSQNPSISPSPNTNQNPITSLSHPIMHLNPHTNQLLHQHMRKKRRSMDPPRLQHMKNLLPPMKNLLLPMKNQLSHMKQKNQLTFLHMKRSSRLPPTLPQNKNNPHTAPHLPPATPLVLTISLPSQCLCSLT